MKHNKPNIVIAGDEIYAGVDIDDITAVSHAVVVQFPDAVSYAKSISTGVIEANVFADYGKGLDEKENNFLVATKIIVAADSVECPSCQEVVSGLFLGNPRGKICECSHCHTEFAIANEAVLELR